MVGKTYGAVFQFKQLIRKNVFDELSLYNFVEAFFYVLFIKMFPFLWAFNLLLELFECFVFFFEMLVNPPDLSAVA
jgi:uncharacterized membrane protein